MSLPPKDPSPAPSRDTMMEFATIPGTALSVSSVTLGTWAIGGWLWGGTNEAESIATIRTALAHGVNVIDTAPVYGFGHSEEIVGKALADGLRQDVMLATKVGLEWYDGKIIRNGSRDRIMREIDDSLRRLRTDRIDIYQVHWPDPKVPMRRPPRPCSSSTSKGQIRAIGVSNFSVAQMERVSPHRAAARSAAALQSVRACHRGGNPALLPQARDRHVRLRRTLPRLAVGTHTRRHQVRRRRFATERS